MNERGGLVWWNQAFADRFLSGTRPTGGRPASLSQAGLDHLLPPTDLPANHWRSVRRPQIDPDLAIPTAWRQLHFLRIVHADGHDIATLGGIASGPDEKLEPPVHETFAPPASTSPVWSLADWPIEGEVSRRLVDQVQLACRHRLPVTFVGEAGAGKQMWARLLHRETDGSARPLVIADAEALTPDDLRRDWLGEGWQTGLLDRTPAGTLIVLQVGDLPADLQEELARRLERPDFGWRVLATTRRTLEADLADGRLMRRLYYRLSTTVIVVPALREQRDEFARHCQRVLDTINSQQRRSIERIEAAMMDRLRDHPWPGNFRELRVVLELAVDRCEDAVLTLAMLPPALQQSKPRTPARPKPQPMPLPQLLDQVERRMLELALSTHQGNKAQAADWLGISRAKLLRRLEHFEKGGGGETGAPTRSSDGA